MSQSSMWEKMHEPRERGRKGFKDGELVHQEEWMIISLNTCFPRPALKFPMQIKLGRQHRLTQFKEAAQIWKLLPSHTQPLYNVEG